MPFSHALLFECAVRFQPVCIIKRLFEMRNGACEKPSSAAPIAA
jgi:hypothetical protein